MLALLIPLLFQLQAGALAHRNYCCAPDALPEEKSDVTVLLRFLMLTVPAVALDMFVMCCIWYLVTEYTGSVTKTVLITHILIF